MFCLRVRGKTESEMSGVTGFAPGSDWRVLDWEKVFLVLCSSVVDEMQVAFLFGILWPTI